MKYVIFSCLFSFQTIVKSQIFGNEIDWGKENKFTQTFWSGGSDGYYLGYGRNRELGTFSQSVALKVYSTYYTLYNAHISYKQLLNTSESLPQHNINLGMSLYLFGADINYYFGNNRSFFTFMPKISVDVGSLTFEYGYQLGKTERLSHVLKLSYFLFLRGTP